MNTPPRRIHASTWSTGTTGPPLNSYFRQGMYGREDEEWNVCFDVSNLQQEGLL